MFIFVFVYRKDYVDLMKSTQKMTDSELHTLSDKYDSVYIHPVRAHSHTHTHIHTHLYRKINCDI